MRLYQREKIWYYDFMYRCQRYRGCIGPVSKTIAKETMAKKKAEAVEERYDLPSKKPSPRLDEFVKEDFAYYQANRKARSLQRHQTSYRALEATFGHQRLSRHLPSGY